MVIISLFSAQVSVLYVKAGRNIELKYSVTATSFYFLKAPSLVILKYRYECVPLMDYFPSCKYEFVNIFCRPSLLVAMTAMSLANRILHSFLLAFDSKSTFLSSTYLQGQCELLR